MRQLMIAVTAATLLTSGGVFAQGGTNQPTRPPGGPRGPGGPRFEMQLIPPRLMDDLALTAEQKAKVEVLQADFAKERDKLRASETNNPEFAKLRDEMRAARDAGDREKMRSLREQLVPYQKPILDLRRQYMDKVRSLLTDEQKKTLEEAIQRRGPRGPGGPRGMGGPPHGAGEDGPPPPPPPPPDKD
jgi:Spy/CpxP family protein refolding chaperone